MRKLLLVLFPVVTLLPHYNYASADQTQTPSKQPNTRYGIEHVKLGFPTESSIKYINSLTKTELSCSEKKIALGKMKRNFTYKTCKLPKKHSDVILWDEALQKVNLDFLDNKLINLSLEFKTSKDYQALYDKHGKRILNLLGEPKTIDLGHISWERREDKAVVEEKKKGHIHLHIFNKLLQKHLNQQ